MSPLIPDVQHGFIRGRSSLTQLLQYLDSLYRATDTTNLVDSVYLDFSKAFDKIDHSILLNKLHSLGVRSRLQKVLTSYLNGRTQFVEVNGVQSATLPILSGVPQGSLLGPLLFLIYSFDFCEELASDAFTFADDAKLLSIRKRLSPPHVLQHDMQLLHRWSEKNKLPFNLEKCHVLTFTKTSLQVFIGDHLLTHSTEEKYLGVMITNDLKCNTHIFSRCKKAHCVLHMLMRNVSPLASWRTKCDLYMSMVLPVLTYCSPVWSPSKAALTKLEQVQTRSTAWILSYDCTYRDRLIFLNLLPLTLNFQVYDLLTF